MSVYRKPLKGGGCRIIPRKQGKFARESLNLKTCWYCGGFIVPESVNIGTKEFPFIKQVQPEKCGQCGRKLDEETKP